eukprot:1588386-Rhodomonas_salina.1
MGRSVAWGMKGETKFEKHGGVAKNKLEEAGQELCVPCRRQLRRRRGGGGGSGGVHDDGGGHGEGGGLYDADGARRAVGGNADLKGLIGVLHEQSFLAD